MSGNRRKSIISYVPECHPCYLKFPKITHVHIYCLFFHDSGSEYTYIILYLNLNFSVKSTRYSFLKGEGQKERGIYIKSVVPNGAASQVNIPFLINQSINLK